MRIVMVSLSNHPEQRAQARKSKGDRTYQYGLKAKSLYCFATTRAM